MSTPSQNEPWVEKFLADILRPDLSNEAIARAMAIKDSHIPRTLYRYRSFDAAGFTFQGLESDQVWLNAGDKFNDPFDSRFRVSIEAAVAASTKRNLTDILREIELDLTASEIEEIRRAENPLAALTNRLASRYPEVTADLQQQVVAASSEFIDSVMNEPISKLMKRTRSNFALCCFTTDHCSTLMWSHYAQSHSGICIEYDFGALSPDDIRRRALYPVIYRSEMFDATPYLIERINTGTGNSLLGLLAALFKAAEWAYEREWRFITPLGPRLFQMPTPQAIYLGTNVTDENRNRVMRVSERRGIRVASMALAPNGFGLAPV